MNVLRGILKSEMVEANVLMEHIEGMNLLLVLIWIDQVFPIKIQIKYFQPKFGIKIV